MNKNKGKKFIQQEVESWGGFAKKPETVDKRRKPQNDRTPLIKSYSSSKDIK